MCKRLVYLMCLILIWGHAQWALGADPNMVGLWRCDEGTGTVANDSSGNGNHGIFNGDPQWVEGYSGAALEFDGDGDFLNCGSDPSLDLTKWTVAFWLNINQNKNYSGFVVKGLDAAETWEVLGFADGSFHFPVTLDSGRTHVNSSAGVIVVGEWAHIAYTYDTAEGRRLYKDGNLIFEDTQTGIPQASTEPLLIGNEGGTSRFVNGIMDDIAIFDYSMTVEEINKIMEGFTPPGLATNPNPEDEIMDVPRNVAMSWTAGEFAAKRNVYVGMVFDDVNEAGISSEHLVSQGQGTTTYDAGVLEFGQTYYWRVDEVNGAPDNTVFIGDVWSFTVEPLGIPIENIIATASGANPTMEASKTIDGSGLNALDQHSSQPTDMWLTLTDGSWIQYEFDRAYKLHEMLVWNSNQVIEPFIGFGVKEALVETSLDGITWDQVEGVGPFSQASGQTTYLANTAVDLSGIVAKYVKISPQSAYGFTGQAGLSEVRFLALPNYAREFVPADASTTDSVEVALNWRGGREAASHQINLGIDADNLVLAGTTNESTLITDPLDYAQTYFWQVVEINEAETPATYVSDILSFTTAASGIVDDFESYSGDEGREVFMTWFDGYGGDASLGGSTTGHINGPFVETSIVYGSSQSMPVYIDNDGGFVTIDGASSSPNFSEVVRDLDAQDWTASGIKTLSIMFSGSQALTGQLYCKINGTKVTYDGDASNLSLGVWQAWNIDLSTVTGNLTNVRELAIGIEGGSSGILYIDEIRVYPQMGEYIIPTEPDASG